MPKKLLETWNSVKNVQNTLPKDRAEELNTLSPFFGMLTVMGNAADVYDKNGNRLEVREWQDRIAEQQQKKRSGENIPNDVFYLHSHADESEMYVATVEYGEFNPSVTMGNDPIPEQDRDMVLVQPQKAKGKELEEPEAEEPEIEPEQVQQVPSPEEVSKKILEAFDAFEQEKTVVYSEDRDIDWEAAASTYFGFLSNLKDEVNVYDKLGQPLDKEAWQNQIIERQQNALDGTPAQSDTFYLQSNKNESVRFAMTVAYDGKTPTMTMEREPLSAKEWGDRIATSTMEAIEAQEAAAKKERQDSAVDRFFAAWKEVEDFKKSPGMENRGMDILSTNKLNRALKTVQEITFVSDKDGNPMTGDVWTSLLTAKQSTYEKGEKVPTETFYLRCKDDVSKMFKLSVDFGKTKPTFTLDKTPLPDKDLLELTGKWEAEKTAHEAFKEAGLDLDDLRMRRELIASAPQRLLNAFKGIQDMKKAPNFKRPETDMGVLELGKNLENVQGVATVCDAAGNKLEGKAWLEHIAAQQTLRATGEKVPKGTFYLTCKEDNSKMFKVTVEYGKNKPKFKIDKTPVAEDDRWKLRGEWQKNAAAAQKAAAQLDVNDPSAEDSPEKQNQKEKTAVAAKNLEKGAATEKNLEKVAKNATETVITPSLDERRKAAGKDAHGYEEPSWKKYDVNAKKANKSGLVMEMGELEPMAEEKEPESPLKNLAQELAEKEKEWDAKRSPEERDMDHISKKVNSVSNKEISNSLKKNDAKIQEQTKEMTKAFRRDVMDAAKENDSVRSLLANMEASTMQTLYKTYSDDVAKGIDPRLKGVLNKAVQEAEAEKNAGIGVIDKSAEYFPIPNNEDLENEQLQQQQREEEDKAIEEIQVKQTI